MNTPDLPMLDGCRLVVLRHADIGALQALLESCEAFEILVSGAPPAPDAAAELLVDRPPALPLDRKLVLGVESESGLIGVVDLLRDFPAASGWYLGLMLLKPQARGAGLGARLYEALAGWIASQGGERIRLAVQTQNTGGLRFWTRLGFSEIRRTNQQAARRENQVLVLERALPP